MNKSDFSAALAEKAGLSKVDGKKAVDAFLAVVSEGLATGEKITFPGFGTFSVSERAERTGRNPQTGATITIAAKKVAKFKAGATLSSSL